MGSWAKLQKYMKFVVIYSNWLSFRVNRFAHGVVIFFTVIYNYLTIEWRQCLI